MVSDFGIVLLDRFKTVFKKYDNISGIIEILAFTISFSMHSRDCNNSQAEKIEKLKIQSHRLDVHI